jgi:hypothetical protein
MPGNTRPKKRYRGPTIARSTYRNPVLYAMESVGPVSQRLVDKLRLQELGAIESFAQGKGNPQEWETLARMCNVSEHLGEHGCGHEAVPAAQAAAKHLMDSLQRAQTDGTLTLDADGIAAMREVREFVDLQFQSLTVGELDVHFKRLREEMRQLKGRVGKP